MIKDNLKIRSAVIEQAVEDFVIIKSRKRR